MKRYRAFVDSALHNPAIVSVHRFEFRDATSGRGDGENYINGFVSIADMSYRELITYGTQAGNSLVSLHETLDGIYWQEHTMRYAADFGKTVARIELTGRLVLCVY